MPKSLVSIIVPIFNGSRFLSETIESCVNQSYGDIEIILIDDASSDESLKIAREFSESHSNIKVLSNSLNKGLMRTNNIALTEAKGAFVIFLGQDDLIESMHVEKMVKFISDGDAMVVCNSTYIDENGRALGNVASNTKLKFRAKKAHIWLAGSNIFPSTGALLRMSSLKNSGGWPENFKNYGEWEMWIKMCSHGKIALSPDSVAKYRRHSNNLTNSFSSYYRKNELLKYALHCRKEALRNSKNIFSLGLACLYTTRDIFYLAISRMRTQKCRH